jgi:hypothetical protein
VTDKHDPGIKMEIPMKKTATGLVMLVLGAASVSAALTFPAFADDATPVTGGSGNCSTARDAAPNKHCLTKPKEGDKKGYDQYAKEHPKVVPYSSVQPTAPIPYPTTHVKYADIVSGKAGTRVGGSTGGAGRGSAPR